MPLLLLSLLSFLLGILAALSLPFLQKKQAKNWRQTLKIDLINDQKMVFEAKEKELFLKEERLEAGLLKLKVMEKEKSELEKKKKELLGGNEEEVKSRILFQLEDRIRKEHFEHLELLRREGDREAKKIVITAIQRLSPKELLQTFVEKIFFIEESFKARIVGPEGKNIRFLEDRLGVKLILDKELTISSFNPEKRFFAKRVIETLLIDGKIFPKRIEEVIEIMNLQFEGEVRKIGEETFKELGLSLPHPAISHILGKLAFRYSFGQNLLDHSKEVAGIMGNLASELHLSTSLGKRIGLLHDIGKAIESSEESHALAGMEFLKAHGESEAVSNGVGCHHFEVEPLTAIGSLCHLADALSAGRDGVRGEKVDESTSRKNFKGQMLSF